MSQWSGAAVAYYDVPSYNSGQEQLLPPAVSFDFTCMVPVEIDIGYNQIVRETGMKNQKVDKNV